MAGEFTRRITGQAAVSEVMRDIGLQPPPSISSSLDKSAIQFWSQATKTGQQLLDKHDWQVLEKEFTITTDGVTLEYALPADFDHFFQDSSWNRTSRLPMLGSLTQQEWQLLQARNLGGTTVAMMYQISEDKVVFYSVGTAAQTLVLPYISRAWVVQADNTTYRDNLANDDDVIRFDPQLFKAALKLQWRSSKGFDTSAALLEYNDCLSAAKAKDSPARTLSLDRRPTYPLIGVLNIPDTSYGT